MLRWRAAVNRPIVPEVLYPVEGSQSQLPGASPLIYQWGC
jgi:hypothetical protein